MFPTSPACPSSWEDTTCCSDQTHHTWRLNLWQLILLLLLMLPLPLTRTLRCEGHILLLHNLQSATTATTTCLEELTSTPPTANQTTCYPILVACLGTIYFRQRIANPPRHYCCCCSLWLLESLSRATQLFFQPATKNLIVAWPIQLCNL